MQIVYIDQVGIMLIAQLMKTFIDDTNANDTDEDTAH